MSLLSSREAVSPTEQLYSLYWLDSDSLSPHDLLTQYGAGAAADMTEELWPRGQLITPHCFTLLLSRFPPSQSLNPDWMHIFKKTKTKTKKTKTKKNKKKRRFSHSSLHSPLQTGSLELDALVNMLGLFPSSSSSWHSLRHTDVP